METACLQCKVPVSQPDVGRPRLYCSGRCRVVAHRQKQRATKGGLIPVELVGRKRFVRHIRKRPITPAGRPSSVTVPSTWGTIDQVLASNIGDGIGYVLGDGVGCIDLDDCIRGDGELSSGAAWVLAKLEQPTWIEVSPSGKGLHVWGLLPEGPGTVRTALGQTIETYSKDRYITITGNRWKGAPLELSPLPLLS